MIRKSKREETEGYNMATVTQYQKSALISWEMGA